MGETSRVTLGRYELVERLAVGGMAELYRARIVGAHGFEKPLVIKKILPHLAADPQFVDMFIDEAKITASLVHPKIVQVHELGINDEGLFIAMDFVDGLDLLSVLRACKSAEDHLPQELAAHIAHEVLDALEYAHSACSPSGEPLGVVHRDISPGNILCSHRGDVKLVDFGIARAAQRQHHTQAGTLKGKYGYMSPEQITGLAIDGRSDLFSVGVVLAEMLMGRRLFTAPSELEVLLMVRDVSLERLDMHGAHIDPELRAILGKAMVRSPDERYQNARDFRQALSDWLYARGRPIRPERLAEFLDYVSKTRSQRQQARAAGLAPFSEQQPEPTTLSGAATRARKLQAEEAARVGRALFVSGRTPKVRLAGPEPTPRPTLARTDPEPPDDDDDDDIPIVFEDVVSAPVLEPSAAVGPRPPAIAAPALRPDEEGDFRTRSAVSLLHDLAQRRANGLLQVERGPSLKEAYFRHGVPEFIRSNVPSERLGEYLVAEGKISRDQLSRALAVLPHFGGRLGDTLVGLELMKPLDAYRHLARQVRSKLVDVCTWPNGSYRFYDNRPNPWPTLALHLDTFEIIGAGAMSLSEAWIGRWALEVSDRTPLRQRMDARGLEAFCLGQRPAYVFNQLHAGRTVRSHLSRFSKHDRLEVAHLLYLLIETGHAHWA